jgi:hypothetical protein
MRRLCMSSIMRIAAIIIIIAATCWGIWIAAGHNQPDTPGPQPSPAATR